MASSLMIGVKGYIYCPIPMHSIRLLRLDRDHASTNPTTISGSLVTVGLSDAPPYFALSYCWGNQAQDVPIEIDGEVLHVTRSLETAIRRLCQLSAEDLRWIPSKAYVWIDQICINLDDMAERSTQVKLMHSIYSQAIMTVVWLGPVVDSCHDAWRLIDQIYRIFRRENPDAVFLNDIPFRLFSAAQHVSYGLPDWDDDLWRQLRKLFELPWFTRTWIIQEVALSQQDPVVVHGSYVHAWHRLAWAASWLRRNGYLRLDHIPNQVQNVDTIANMRRSRSPWSLDALLVTTSMKFHATNQRDKVYGLLGLAAESQVPTGIPEDLLPNYALDLPQIYTKVALCLLRKSKNLSMLTRTTRPASENPRVHQQSIRHLLPSWAPNWCDFTAEMEAEITRSFSWLYYSNAGGATVLGFPEHYKASADLPAQVIESPDPKILRLRGLRLDSVSLVEACKGSPLSSPKPTSEPALLRFWKITLEVFASAEAMDPIDAFIKTTTAEQYRLGGRDAQQLRHDGSAYLISVLTNGESDSGSLQQAHPEILDALRDLAKDGHAESYEGLARNFCANRAFFVTADRRNIGIGPVEMAEGDVIAVLFGGGVPYILRPQGQHYAFVGESYLLGLMDGQAVKEWRAGRLADTDFGLR